MRGSTFPACARDPAARVAPAQRGTLLLAIGRPDPAPLPAQPHHRSDHDFGPAIRAACALTATALASPGPARRPFRGANHQAQARAELKYQGPAGPVLRRRRQGLLQGRRPRGAQAIDQGNGLGRSRARWSRTAASMDVGFGDINALIELAAKKPDDAPIAVYVMFNQPPFTIAVKADGPIKTPKDFEGKTLGGASPATARSSCSRRFVQDSPRSTARRSRPPTCSRICASRCSCKARSTACSVTSTPSSSPPN